MLILTTLIIGTGAAQSWNSPDDNSEHDQDVFMSTDFSGVSNINNVTVYYEDPDSNDLQEHEEASNPNGDNFTSTFDAGSSPHGDYEFKFKAFNGSSSPNPETEVRTFTLDGPPSITFPDDDYISNDPTLTVEVSDDHTGVSGISGSANNDATVSDTEDFDSCDAGESCEVDFDIDTDDLNSGDAFDLDVTATDQVGIENSDSQSFTFDDEYEGSSSVDFEYDNGYIYLMSDDSDDLEFNVDLGGSEDEDAEIRLTCYEGSIDEDNQFDQTDFEDVDDEGREYSCEIPGDEYTDESVDVVIEACDEAGNCEEVGETTYTMDFSDPFIADLETSSDVNTFNSEFEVTFDASDSATSVEEMEYFFNDETLDEGEGTEISNFDDGSSNIDPSGLDSGENTLYIRAKDEADRWSDPESYDFEYYPEQSPELSLTAPESFSLNAGESGSFEVTLDNTGEFLVESVEVSVSSDVFSSSETVSELEPGEFSDLEFSTSANESSIGEYTITVSTESPSTTASFDYRIRANQEQQQEIQSEVDQYSGRLEDLESNVTELKSKVNQEKADRLEENLSEFRSQVQEAESAIESGEYYRAQSALSGIGSTFSSAQSSYGEVQDEYRSSQQMMFMLLGLGIVVLSGAGVVGYLHHEGRIDLNEHVEKVKDMEVGSDSSSSGDQSPYGTTTSDSGSGQGLIDKIKNMFESAGSSDAEDFEWDGFKDK